MAIAFEAQNGLSPAVPPPCQGGKIAQILALRKEIARHLSRGRQL